MIKWHIVQWIKPFLHTKLFLFFFMRVDQCNDPASRKHNPHGSSLMDLLAFYTLRYTFFQVLGLPSSLRQVRKETKGILHIQNNTCSSDI